MTIWLPRLASGRPRYLAIAEALREDVQRGVLQPGDRLPTHRDLAWALKITTGTVTRAYAEAEKMGLLVGEVGRGSFVRQPGAMATPFMAAAAREDTVIDLSQASPPQIHQTQDLDEALSQVMAQSSRIDLLDYTPPQGHPLHRAMGVAWLARSGIRVAEDQVVVTSGAHAGLIAALAALSQHGEELLVEPLNYPTLRPIARHLGLTLVPVESDAEGMLPDSVDRAAREGTARMLYVVPSFHNPTTVSLSLARRQALAAIARRHAMTVIEDDIFRLLDARVQPETLFTLAPERTWHVTSVSKTLAPGLRVGFVVTPPGKTETLIRHQTVAAGRAVGLAAEVARHWIAGDAADRILAAIIAENAARRDMAIDIFRGRNFSCAPGAPYLWLRLPEHWPPGEFARAALERGVRLTPGTAFAMARRADDHGVRVCFGGTATRPQLGSALHTINSLLEEAPDMCFAAVA